MIEDWWCAFEREKVLELLEKVCNLCDADFEELSTCLQAAFDMNEVQNCIEVWVNGGEDQLALP